MEMNNHPTLDVLQSFLVTCYLTTCYRLVTIQSLNPLRKKKSVILGIEWDEFMGGEDIWATPKMTDSFFVRTTVKLNAISPSLSMIASNLVWVYVCDYLLLQAGRLSQRPQQLGLGGADTDIAHQGLPHKCCHQGWGYTLGLSYFAAFCHSDDKMLTDDAQCSVMLKDNQMMHKDDQYRRPTNKKKIIHTNWFGQHLLQIFVNQPHLQILTSFFLWLVEFGRQELRSLSQQRKSQGM